MCRSTSPFAVALLAAIMLVTIGFLVGTIPPAETVEAATWAR